MDTLEDNPVAEQIRILEKCQQLINLGQEIRDAWRPPQPRTGDQYLSQSEEALPSLRVQYIGALVHVSAQEKNAIRKKLEELRWEEKRAKQVQDFEEATEKMLRSSVAATSALKRRRVGQVGKINELEEMQQQTERVSALCKKLKVKEIVVGLQEEECQANGKR